MIPLGPQLQAQWKSPEGAQCMHYQNRKTDEIKLQLMHTGGLIKEYDNIHHGTDYIEAVNKGQIKDDDVIIRLSLNGA